MTTHAELARRYEIFVGRLWMFGAEVWIEASTRSYETQLDLYRRWKAGTYKSPIVANPDKDLGASPFGWHVHGSYHMPQEDGFSHALDLGWRGISDSMVTEIAHTCGLHQVVPGEKWHMQWFDTTGVFDVTENPKDDDMTADEFKQALKEALGDKAVIQNGTIYLPLEGDTPEAEHQLYPLGDTLIFIHAEEKRARLGR